MTMLLHDPSTCTREPCGRCASREPARPPKPNGHDVQPPLHQRDTWDDLAAELEAAAAFARKHGANIEQRFYEWQRLGRLPDSEERGGGNGGATTGDQDERRREDAMAARQLHLLRLCVADLLGDVRRFRGFEGVAFPKGTKLEPKHLTAAQVEADGWCGSHWRIGEFVAIATRPSGEPFYRGRCRRCGEWPEGDPPVDVLRTWKSGRTARVKAS